MMQRKATESVKQNPETSPIINHHFGKDYLYAVHNNFKIHHFGQELVEDYLCAVHNNDLGQKDVF